MIQRPHNTSGMQEAPAHFERLLMALVTAVSCLHAEYLCSMRAADAIAFQQGCPGQSYDRRLHSERVSCWSMAPAGTRNEGDRKRPQRPFRLPVYALAVSGSKAK